MDRKNLNVSLRQEGAKDRAKCLLFLDAKNTSELHADFSQNEAIFSQIYSTIKGRGTAAEHDLEWKYSR